jgi:hypothetical protein
MAAATKKRKEKKKLTLGRPALVAGTQQTLSNLFWRLSISMLSLHCCPACRPPGCTAVNQMKVLIMR